MNGYGVDGIAWKQAIKNSEFASRPKSELEEKFAILHKCKQCDEYFFCANVNHPSYSKCDCIEKKFGMTCFLCFHFGGIVELPYGEHVEAFLDSENSYPVAEHVKAFWISDNFRKIIEERGMKK